MSPKEPIESVKRILRLPTVLIALSTLFIPPITTASASSGLNAVSTDCSDRQRSVRLSRVCLQAPEQGGSSRRLAHERRGQVPHRRVLVAVLGKHLV